MEGEEGECQPDKHRKHHHREFADVASEQVDAFERGQATTGGLVSFELRLRSEVPSSRRREGLAEDLSNVLWRSPEPSPGRRHIAGPDMRGSYLREGQTVTL